jgi:hypothetical protein
MMEFQAHSSRIVKLVVLARGFITSAVSHSPHAVSAWAGVCINLHVRIVSFTFNIIYRQNFIATHKPELSDRAQP